MAAEAPRKWTDVKHEATFVSLFQSGTKVKLRYAHNGSIVAIPLDRLSEADKAYVRDAVARSKQGPGAEKEEMIGSSLYSARSPPGTMPPAPLITSAISPLAFSPQPQPNAGGYFGYQDPRANPPLAQPMPPPQSMASYPMPLSSGQASTPQYVPSRQSPVISSGYYQNPTTATVAAHNNAAFSAMQPVSYSVPSPSSSPAGSGNSSPIYRNSIILPQSNTKVAASAAPAVSRPESHHSPSNSPGQANRYSQLPVSTNYGYPQSQTPAQQQQPAVSSAPTAPNSGFAQQYSLGPRHQLAMNPGSAPYSTATQQQPVVSAMNPGSAPYSTATQQQPVVSPASAPYPTASNSASARQSIPTPQQQPVVSPVSALYPTASGSSSTRSYTPAPQQQPVVSPASAPYPTASDSSSTRQFIQQQLVASPASAPNPTASVSSSTRQYTPTPQQQPVASPAPAPYPTASGSSSTRSYTPTPQQQPVASSASAPYPTASNPDSARQHDSAPRAYSAQLTAAPAASPAFMASTPPSPSSAVASAATHRPPSNPKTSSGAAAAATHRPPSNPTAAAAATYPSPSNHTTTSIAEATHRPPSNLTAAYPQPQPSPPEHPEFGKGAPMSNPALIPVAAQQQQPYSRNPPRPQAHVDVVQADRQIYAPALSTAAQTITAVRKPASGLSNKPAPTPQIPQSPQTTPQNSQNSQNSQNLQGSRNSQNSQFPNTQSADVDALYDELINSVTPALKVTRTPGPSTAPAPSNAVTRVVKAPPRTTAALPAQNKARPTFQTLPQAVFVRITQYLDMRSLFSLYRTSKTIHTMLRENPECWQYITFAPSYLEKVDHKFVEAMVAWLTRERLIHYVHSVVYDSTKVQEITVVQTLERFPALEHLSIERCWDVYSYPLANLLTVRSSHRSIHLAMLKSFRIGNSLYRGTIPQGFAVIAESKSFGQDVGLIDQAITQLAGHEVQFDVYLCENCDTGPCHPIFKCTFCGDVPVKKCWLCTPKCDRCGTRACGQGSCKRDWRLSTEHRCGKCGVAVRLCTNRGCVNTPTCNQCGRYFHTRCSYEISNACGLCEKTVCPFCDLDVCTECKGQWCRKNRCSEVVPCQCGKDKVVCPKDIKRCGTESCRKMAFCSKCLEQHKQKTGHDA